MHRADRPHLTLVPPTKRIQRDNAGIPPVKPEPADHEGGTDDQVGDRTGPAVGYDTDPEQVKDKGGVA